MSLWLRVILGVSLLLNLLVAGFIGGLLFRGGPPPFMAPMAMAHLSGRPLGASWLLDDLPEVRQNELRPVLRQAFVTMRPHLHAIHDAQENVERALTQPQFDRAELQRALAVMQSHMREVDTISRNGMLELAGRLSVDERKQLAGKLRAPPWRHWRSRHDRRVQPDPEAQPERASN